MEVIITLSIVAVLAAATVPIMTDYLKHARLKSVSENIFHDLIYARSQAVKQQSNVTFVFQTGSSWCYGLTTASSCNCLVSASCTLGQVDYTRFKDTSLSASGFTGSSAIFTGTRGLVNQTGSFTFNEASGDSVVVELSKMGFPRICSDDIEGYQSC